MWSLCLILFIQRGLLQFCDLIISVDSLNAKLFQDCGYPESVSVPYSLPHTQNIVTNFSKPPTSPFGND